MLTTSFTRLVGCSVPIQLAGMGPVLTPELAAAVCEAGGLGMVTMFPIPATAASAMLDAIRQKTAKPFGVNFLIPAVDPECLEVASQKARVVDFFWGDPDRSLVDRVHAGGAIASWQVGSRREALAAADAGCDFVIAQGNEAGGHIRGTLGVLPLLSEILDAVEIPVLAAGGIGSARTMAAVLAAGAAGVRVGTRFIAASESGAHPTYVQAVIRADAEDSLRTSLYAVGCPLCPSTHGVLRSAIEAAEAFDGDVVGELTWGGQVRPIPKFGGTPPPSGVRGAVEAMALYAGQSVGSVREVKPASDIVHELADGAQRLLRLWADRVAALSAGIS